MPSDRLKPPMLAKPLLSTSTMMSLICSWTAVTISDGHHQVRSVAQEDINLAAGIGELGTHGAGDFVAHTGIAVLHVIAVGRARSPELVQVARMAASSRKQHVARAGSLPHRADHFALSGLGLGIQMEQAVDFRLPGLLQLGDLSRCTRRSPYSLEGAAASASSVTRASATTGMAETL